MRFFVDTSVLFKKYVDEPGSKRFEDILSAATEIIVAPTAWVEMHSTVERRLRDRTITSQQASELLSELKIDFDYYSRVIWNQSLEEKAVEVIKNIPLKSLDAIQLASAILAEPDMFITSDKQLFKEARKMIKGAGLI